jgi:hypothetical protein
MKFVLIAAAVATSLGAALALGAPAMAQPDDSWMGPAKAYGTLGYSNFEDHSNTSAVTGRLGVRAGRYLGVEGEGSVGVATGQTHAFGGTDHVRLNGEYAGYAVGYLPVAHNADLFARVGYGATSAHISDPVVSEGRFRAGVAYGAGGQYFFQGPNGVRVDYTRMNYGPTTGDSNVWSMAYVRKF